MAVDTKIQDESVKEIVETYQYQETGEKSKKK